jgi:hypothetical protein
MEKDRISYRRVVSTDPLRTEEIPESEHTVFQWSNGGACENYVYGARQTRVYPVTEAELDALRWSPFWTRKALLNRIKREAAFD